MCLAHSGDRNMSLPHINHGREAVPEPGTAQPRVMNHPTGPSSPPKESGWASVSQPHLQHSAPPGRYANIPRLLFSPEQDLQVRSILAELENLHGIIRQSDAAVRHFLTSLPPTLRALWQLEPKQWKDAAMTPPQHPIQDVSRNTAPQEGVTWDPVTGGTAQAQNNRYEGYRGSLHPAPYMQTPTAHVTMEGLPTSKPGKRRRL